MKFTPKTAGQLRHLLTSGGAMLATSGVIGQEDVMNIETVGGAFITILGFVLSFFAKEKKG